jgi:hypothetical protein
MCGAEHTLPVHMFSCSTGSSSSLPYVIMEEERERGAGSIAEN